MEVIRYQRITVPALLVPVSIAGVLILLPAWYCLVQLQALEPQGKELVLFVMLLVWTADIGAYFSGRRWGRRKLASRVSPGKSWEGVLGGMTAALLLGIVYTLYAYDDNQERLLFMFICFITVSGSILGDLMESLAKRQADIKDSGSILPGHGGVLDRIDSLTAALPLFFCAIWLGDLA